MPLPLNESSVLFFRQLEDFMIIWNLVVLLQKCLLHKQKKNQSKHKPNISMYPTNILKMMAKGKSVVYIQSKCLSLGVK